MVHEIDRRRFLQSLGLGAVACALSAGSNAASGRRKPNFVVIFADDLGYGDLGCYGNPTIRTPNLDRMAMDGMRMTSFYAAPVCSPSRAALLTGRYPVRCGMPGNTGPGSKAHLPESEITIANVLGSNGYRTMAIGKWHLGHQRPELLPTGRGFDSWFGLPYSNDMIKPFVQTDEPLNLYRDTEIIERHPVNQDTLTERYTDEAVSFIENAGDSPFFLYLAHSMPHLPLHTTQRFRGQSRSGLYGDVIETIDWSTGRIREALRDAGVEDDTLLIFTSDNGPWMDLPDRMLQKGNMRWHSGSPGSLRGWKGTTYEGGLRVPMLACWPDHIAPGSRSDELASTLDLFPTMAITSGAKLPDDRTYDGSNILPLLEGKVSTSPDDEFFYFRGKQLQAVRDATWKLRQENPDAELELFHLGRDPRELYNVAADHPDVVARLQKRMREFEKDVQQH